MRRTYRQNKETGKFEEVNRSYSQKLASVTDDLVPFISPVDGSHISTKGELERHNKRNGVTNDIDSLKEKASQQLARQRAPVGNKDERVKDIVSAHDFVTQNQHLYQ